MKEARPIFIVGNSRSGTTMMMRIMNRHHAVHAINEPHFFGTLWSSDDQGLEIDRSSAHDLLSRLFTRQRAGFFEEPSLHKHKYAADIEQLLDELYEQHGVTRAHVYRGFLFFEAKANAKSIPCEKTPQNVFYLKEILSLFPNARIINMIRDPRATMLSQKNKWKRRQLGADFMTAKETRRLRANYHPITMSRLWKAAVRSGMAWKGNESVMKVQFEALIQRPEETLDAVCQHVGITFDQSMLDIPHAGSSLTKDEKGTTGIRKVEPKSWEERGLKPAEIYWCQRLCAAEMEELGYVSVDHGANWLQIFYSALAFPIKLTLALLLNLNRVRNLGDTLRRRLKN